MSEKKILVDGLRFSYNGIFDVIDFYRHVEDWMQENGMEKEIKKKGEHVAPTGKKIEWMVECWKNEADFAKAVVRLRALFNDVTDVEMVKDGSKRVFQKGSALVIIDGFLETTLSHHWTNKPWFFFLRTIYDKLFHKVWTERYDERVRNYSHDLFNSLKAFFNLYKY